MRVKTSAEIFEETYKYYKEESPNSIDNREVWVNIKDLKRHLKRNEDYCDRKGLEKAYNELIDDIKNLPTNPNYSIPRKGRL